MIVNSTNSQIDDRSFLPLIAVKNGLVTRLFSDGLVKVGNDYLTLQLPNARYDYWIEATVFTLDSYGRKTYSHTSKFFVDRKQTSITLQLRNVNVALSTELITNEV